MSENKTILLASVGILTLIAVPIVSHQIDSKRKADLELKKAELEAGYPPEYWLAKKAEAEASAQVKKEQIESQERLKIDKREREETEIARKREFELHAPAEYWEQKRIESEEQTKRELNEQRYKAEQKIAEQHNAVIQQGLTATERALKRGLENNYGIVI